MSDKTISRLVRRRFSQKTNGQISFFLLFYSSWQKNPNSFVRFLGESMLRQSAYGFILPLVAVKYTQVFIIDVRRTAVFK